MVAARSLSFDPSGSRLFVGLKNEIRIFDVNIPGRNCEVRKTFTKKRKLNEQPGLSGIISCIAFNPALPTIFALATYSRHLGVYLDPLNLLCLNEAQQKGGITHIQFTPDGSKLLAGGRKDKEILVWDLRNPGEKLFQNLFKPRPCLPMNNKFESYDALLLIGRLQNVWFNLSTLYWLCFLMTTF